MKLLWHNEEHYVMRSETIPNHIAPTLFVHDKTHPVSRGYYKDGPVNQICSILVLLFFNHLFSSIHPCNFISKCLPCSERVWISLWFLSGKHRKKWHNERFPSFQSLFVDTILPDQVMAKKLIAVIFFFPSLLTEIYRICCTFDAV